MPSPSQLQSPWGSVLLGSDFCSAGACSGAGCSCFFSVSLVKPFSSQLSAMPSPSQLQSPWGSVLSRSVERFACWSDSRGSGACCSCSGASSCSSAAGAPEVSAPPESGPPQLGHAPAPWPSRTRSPIAICWLFEAWSAVAAYSVPP